MKKFIILSCVVILLFGAIGIAQAIPYNEVQDAGELLTSAQTIGTGVDTISGSLNDDADMFKLYLTAGTFIAQVFNSDFDSQLFLFDSAGMGIIANDDNGTLYAPSRIETTLTQDGIYFLAISAWDYDPISAGGEEIFDDAYTVLAGPTGPGGSDPLSDWQGFLSGNGDYDIRLSPTASSPVPEPATIFLFGLGLLGLAKVNRKK